MALVTTIGMRFLQVWFVMFRSPIDFFSLSVTTEKSVSFLPLLYSLSSALEQGGKCRTRGIQFVRIYEDTMSESAQQVEEGRSNQFFLRFLTLLL